MKFYHPTENTRFHIDYSWFDKNGQDVNVLIYKCLTPEQQERLADTQLDEAFDFVDEDTGEVQRPWPKLCSESSCSTATSRSRPLISHPESNAGRRK